MSQFNKTTSDEVEPTAKRPRVEDSLTDKATIANQSLAWKNLETFICDQVKIVDQSNIRQIFRNLLQVNLIRGRGLLANAIIEAQKNSPKYTNVYAAFVYIINSKFPRIGKLICGRVISLYRESFVANERKNTFILIKFLAHLINQKVLHEKIAFEIVDVLLRNVSSDSVKLAVQFLTECSQKLSRENKKELDSRFSKLSDLLNGPLITQHTKNMIIVLLTERRNRFQVHSTSQSTLNLVNENDKNVHRLECLHLCDREIVLDTFQYDEEYEVNEYLYKEFLKTIVDENSDDKDETNLNSLQNNNDQSNIPAVDTDMASSGSTVADKEN